MLTKRIIPCLDVKNGVVVKGRQFRNHEILGDVLELATRYRNEGADELVFYDIAASAEGRSVSLAWVEAVAKILDIPFCVAGGIRSVADAEAILNAGADKISINSPALERPELINEMSARFGAQCVVVGVDSKRDTNNFIVYQYTGSDTMIRSTPKKTMDWIREAEERGAGEIVLNCMDSDGMGGGYDIEQLQLARKTIQIPLIASGGARNSLDFERVFLQAGVDGALAAGAFHRRELLIPDLKNYLASKGIEARI